MPVYIAHMTKELNLDEKDEALRVLLAALDTALVAYSGGTDSAFLAWAAHRALGPRMLAVLADSPSLPRQELKSAISFAEEKQIPLKMVAREEMERPEYVRNDAARCCHCKDTEAFLFLLRRHELLKEVPVYSSGIDAELVTPTGGALLRALGYRFPAFPPMQVEKVGYGAGMRNLSGAAQRFAYFRWRVAIL